VIFSLIQGLPESWAESLVLTLLCYLATEMSFDFVAYDTTLGIHDSPIRTTHSQGTEIRWRHLLSLSQGESVILHTYL